MGMMHACMHEWQLGLACGLRWVRLVVVVVLMYACICCCISGWDWDYEYRHRKITKEQ